MSLNIIPYKVKRDRRARRGSEAIKEGTEVFLIATARRDLYFAWCYTRRSDAEMVKGRLEKDLNDPFLQWNFKNDPELSVHYSGKPIQ